jgi:hypothetical protein
MRKYRLNIVAIHGHLRQTKRMAIYVFSRLRDHPNPVCRAAVRKLNKVAAQLAEALDQFEVAVRDRLPVSAFDCAPSTWPSSS